MQLPYISGKKILQQMGADKRLAKTRVILATADMLRQDVDLVLIKPISFIQPRDLAMRLRPPDTVDLG